MLRISIHIQVLFSTQQAVSLLPTLLPRLLDFCSARGEATVAIGTLVDLCGAE